MAVYVDDMFANYGRMKMCHMIADTQKELLDMARLIGVQVKWIQKCGHHDEHFDICMTKRELAIAAGAIPITMRELVLKVKSKREGRANHESD